MLTQKIIREEVEELKIVMGGDSLTIPSFWDCVKPGVILLLWMAACPFIAFSLVGSSTADILRTTGFSAFLGFIMLFWITNVRAIILSIPSSFRNKSKVITLLSQKVRKYVFSFMITILFLAFLGAYSDTNGMLYLMPMMVALVGFAFLFNTDISRYKLSAFTEVIKSVSASKHTITH